MKPVHPPSFPDVWETVPRTLSAGAASREACSNHLETGFGNGGGNEIKGRPTS